MIYFTGLFKYTIIDRPIVVVFWRGLFNIELISRLFRSQK